MTQERVEHEIEQTAEEILDELLPSLYRFALLTLGNNRSAEKTVMDCCVKVYRKYMGNG